MKLGANYSISLKIYELQTSTDNNIPTCYSVVRNVEDFNQPCMYYCCCYYFLHLSPVYPWLEVVYSIKQVQRKYTCGNYLQLFITCTHHY